MEDINYCLIDKDIILNKPITVKSQPFIVNLPIIITNTHNLKFENLIDSHLIPHLNYPEEVNF